MSDKQEPEVFMLPEDESLTDKEKWAEGVFSTYLIFKYTFIESPFFKRCPNHKKCQDENLHHCGCFSKYLKESYAKQREALEKYQKENKEENSGN